MRNTSYTEQHERRLQFMSGGVATGTPRHTRAKWWPFADKPAYLWCPRCSRCHPNGTFRMRNDTRRCPYGDCSALEKHALGWEEVRAVQTDYPNTPEMGLQYPARLDTVRFSQTRAG